MAQWISFNWNNKPVVVKSISFVVRSKYSNTYLLPGAENVIPCIIIVMIQY